MKFLLLFMGLSIINVVFATVRSLVTIKGGKLVAALISGGYYAYYNIMLIYTVADFPMWQKCSITFICNVIGVYAVKWLEERSRKDKLWKIEATFDKSKTNTVRTFLKEINIPYNYIEGVGAYTIFNIFCATSEESTKVKKMLETYGAKYFVSESKTL